MQAMRSWGLGFGAICLALLSASGHEAAAQRLSAATDGLRPAGVGMGGSVVVEPIRLFDNLYYVGTDFVSSFLITTDEGLILVDALHDGHTHESLANIRELGFDPADIRYLVVTHGHRDHFGGVPVVLEQAAATVAMTAADWDLAGSELDRDRIVEDGDALTLGGTTLQFYVTPGHTPGVLSFLFPVHDGATQYTAFLFGGHNVTGPWPGGGGMRPPLEAMTSSVQRLLTELPEVHVNLTTHPWGSLIFERAEALARRAPGASHPFVDAGDFRAFLGERLGVHRTRLEMLTE